MGKLIAPSILSSDFANLEKEINAVTKAGADWLHVDVMDGHFVPNLTIGFPVVAALKKVSHIPLDVHLMIEKPERYIDDFIKAGSDWLTIHVESTSDVGACLKKIRASGVKAGLTLKPGTPFSMIEPYLSEIDLVLIMTVEPGFGGQKFMSDQVEKINRAAEIRKIKKFQFLIEVDGGINSDTAAQCYAADVLVAGNFIFKQDYSRAISDLKQV